MNGPQAVNSNERGKWFVTVQPLTELLLNPTHWKLLLFTPQPKEAVL